MGDGELGPLAALAEDPAAGAVLTDFDGTLAPIVPDPATAYPLPGAPGVLADLARYFGVVAVVSGRPVSFLADRLAAAGPALRLYGAYGLEWIEDGTLRRAPEAEPWRAAVAEVVGAARSELGDAVGIEDKGCSVTVHWRQAPAEAGRAREFAHRLSQRTGLVLQPGRMAVELRPPIDIDKGVVVERLARGCAAACFAGDDAGDLAAYAALDRLALEGTRTVRIAVVDEETPPELAAAADMVTSGPAQALALLHALATHAQH